MAAATGAVLGVGGFAGASLAGAGANLHLTDAGPGVRALADDESRCWVAASGSGAGPEHDVRLSCAGLDVWGKDLEHRSGQYQITSEEPTGKDQTVVASGWTYDRHREGRQTLAVLAGADLVSAAQAAGATLGEHGYHFALRLAEEEQHERHFWVAACPAAAPAPVPAPLPAAVGAAHVTTPKTGVGSDELGGLVLISAGGGCLAAGSRRRRRKRRLTGVLPEHWSWRGASGLRTCTGTATAPWHVRGATRLAARFRGRAVVAVGAACALGSGLARTAAVDRGRASLLTITLARTAASDLAQLIVPPSPAARFAPVDGNSAGTSPSGINDLDSGIYYAFPAEDGHNSTSLAPAR